MKYIKTYENRFKKDIFNIGDYVYDKKYIDKKQIFIITGISSLYNKVNFKDTILNWSKVSRDIYTDQYQLNFANNPELQHRFAQNFEIIPAKLTANELEELNAKKDSNKYNL